MTEVQGEVPGAPVSRQRTKNRLTSDQCARPGLRSRCNSKARHLWTRDAGPLRLRADNSHAVASLGVGAAASYFPGLGIFPTLSGSYPRAPSGRGTRCSRRRARNERPTALFSASRPSLRRRCAGGIEPVRQVAGAIALLTNATRPRSDTIFPRLLQGMDQVLRDLPDRPSTVGRGARGGPVWGPGPGRRRGGTHGAAGGSRCAPARATRGAAR